MYIYVHYTQFYNFLLSNVIVEKISTYKLIRNFLFTIRVANNLIDMVAKVS